MDNKKECIGIFGKLFGHRFRKFLLKEKCIQNNYVEYNIEGSENVKEFLDSLRNIYIIKCKRCGKEPWMNFNCLQNDVEF